jgi:drug/metabolite transporter (DMT)-like permease
MRESVYDRVTRRGAEALVVGSVLFATAGQTTIKLGLGAEKGLWTWAPYPFHAPLTAGVLIGLLVYACGTALWIAALSQKKLSYLYPLASINYILVALCGSLILHETTHLVRWLGIITMAAGIALLTRVASRSELA